MTKIAIVIDSSGSMEELIGLFLLSDEMRRVPIINFGLGVATSKIVKLLDEYDEVYFVTDGSINEIDLNLIINPRIHIIKIEY